jgi:hypothetical protein
MTKGKRQPEALKVRVTLTQEKVDRWLEAIDPMLARLSGLVSEIIQARTNARAKDVTAFIDRVHGELLDELTKMANTILDAKARVALGANVEGLALALEAREQEAEMAAGRTRRETSQKSAPQHRGRKGTRGSGISISKPRRTERA